jgi:hypothetical protein
MDTITENAIFSCAKVKNVNANFGEKVKPTSFRFHGSSCTASRIPCELSPKGETILPQKYKIPFPFFVQKRVL